jgi:hypothetical protein
MKYFLFILGLLHWICFAYDIENDRDFMTWIWLITSILFFVSSFHKWWIEELIKIKNAEAQLKKENKVSSVS